MREYILNLLKEIGDGKKLSFDETNAFMTKIKEEFGDDEASGFLNTLLASLKVRKNLDPTDEHWKRHFERYNKLPIFQKTLIDALADGLTEGVEWR